MFVDSAVYVDGCRTTPATLGEVRQVCREPGKFAWVALREPTEEEFLSTAGEFGLDKLAVEDATKPHQGPKFQRYGDCFFVVLKSARYAKDAGRIEFGEVHAFVRADLIVTVLYGEEDRMLDGIRERIEGEPERLRRGPAAILYEVMNRVIEGYAPVLDGLENDLDEVEAEVFGGNSGSSRRIHELSREVVRFHQATKPLAGSLERLVESGAMDDLGPEAREHLNYIRDRVLRVTQQSRASEICSPASSAST
jgi:magnesium transporter